jgi:hypothetical protein
VALDHRAVGQDLDGVLKTAAFDVGREFRNLDVRRVGKKVTLSRMGLQVRNLPVSAGAVIDADSGIPERLC